MRATGDRWAALATQLRADSIRATTAAGSGHPTSCLSAADLTRQLADRGGISYLRTTREPTPVLYGADEPFPIGGSKVLRRSEADVAAILAAGITLGVAPRAASQP